MGGLLGGPAPLQEDPPGVQKDPPGFQEDPPGVLYPLVLKAQGGSHALNLKLPLLGLRILRYRDLVTQRLLRCQALVHLGSQLPLKRLELPLA